MQLSRRTLYAMGEPLGECVTLAKPGGGYVCGGGGGSSSSSQTSTTTETTDKRMVIESGIGISSDSSTVSVQAMDAGIVNKALDTIANSSASNGEGYEKLLGLAEKLFDTGAGLIDKTAATSLSAVEAVNSARNDAEGKIDQKTILILAAAGVAAAYAMKKG